MTGRNYTREQIVNIFNQRLESEAKRWGADSYWAKVTERGNVNQLARYDAGEVITVETEDYHEDSMDFTRAYMSDGSVKSICYGYSD